MFQRGIFFFVLMLVLGCIDLKYRDDLHFMGSALANSPEWFAVVNGAPCKDADGLVGGCYKRIRRSEKLKIDLPARPYAYTLSMTCTDSLKSDGIFSVLQNQPFSFEVSPGSYGELNVFNCIGRVNPLDRPEPVQAFFEVRARLIDDRYIEAEEIYPTNYEGKKVVVLGKYARHATIDGKTKSKATVVRAPVGKAMVETHNMRFSYYGY